MSKDEIKAELSKAKEELENVKGTPCSVYSRVVGYLRPVQSYNDGKVEEYRLRKMYNAGNGYEENKKSNAEHKRIMEEMSGVKQFRCCAN